MYSRLSDIIDRFKKNKQAHYLLLALAFNNQYLLKLFSQAVL